VIVLRTDLGGGHCGRPGRLGPLDDIALRYAFALTTLGSAAD
jgi:protease II